MACALQLMAKPAKQGFFTVTDADGSRLKVRLAGDEFFHQYFTEDGYPLLEQNGNYYYCNFDASGNIVNSGIKATGVEMRNKAAKDYLLTVDKSVLETRIQARAAKSPRLAGMNVAGSGAVKAPMKAEDGNDGPPYDRGYGLFPDQRFPAYNDQKAIVILVEYTDVKFKTTYQGGVTAIDYFTRMLNEDDFNDYGGTGSAAQYFRLNSGDSFRPEFDVYGPIALAHNQSYYGGNDWWGNDQNPGAMVKEACDALVDIVDFRDYDRNHDGLVDNVFIFYAGQGEASGGSANTVWPHSWNMTSAGFSQSECTYDGVRVYTYGCSNEWESGRPDGVGTFVHEFSHVMGLPDLYATSYTSAFTPGAWSAMDYGPYNNDGMTPPLYSAFERYALGWLKPWEVDRAISATLPPISENVCGVIRTAKDKEFFLIENRQQESWDTYIPGHGMLVWHVDYDESVWSSNKVNNTPSHQYVDIEEADGTQSDYSRNGDSFPGASNKTSFTASTNPAMKTWNGTAINYPITDIAENNGIITFNVLGGSSEPIPTTTANEPSDVSPESITISWNPVEGYDVLLNVYTRPEPADGRRMLTGAEVYLPGFRNRNMGQATEITIDGLESETLYYYTVALTSGWETSEPSEEMEAFTGRRTINYYKVNTLEADNISCTGFDARWEGLDDAVEYEVTVYEMVPGEPYYDVCNFDNGIENIGNWSSTSNLSYGMASYAGENVPSLRMSEGKVLMSPEYADGVKSVSFWHRGNNTTTGDMINVYAECADGRSLVQEVPVQKELGGVVTEITDIPADAKQIVIEFVRNGDKGYLALDDVKVGHGMQYTPSKLEDYDNVSAGNNLSYKVTDLKPITTYAYSVVANDGELYSKASNLQFVTTSQDSSVSSIAADSAFAISYNGLTISSVTDDQIIVSDYTGALVARGAHKVTLPRAGLYIVSVPSKNYVKKIIVR